MKKLYFLVLVLAAAGCSGKTATNGNQVASGNQAAVSTAGNSVPNSNAVQPKTNDISQVFFSKTLSPDERIPAIQKYVDEIEARLPKENQSSPNLLQRKEASLKAGSLKDVTDENWAKIHFYSDGEMLKRLKAYAPEGSEKSEEYYFYDDKPVFVFIEPKGKELESGDQKAGGDKFYFGDEGLISWIKADGSKPAATDAEFKKYNEKLKKEAAAFKKLK